MAFASSAQGHCSSLPLCSLPVPLSPVGNLSQAVENVLSILLFYPEDDAAKQALTQYQAQLGEQGLGLGAREVWAFVLTAGGSPGSSRCN